MTKRIFKLRKVAMIVAFLAVTTMFTSCGKNGGGDDDDGGSGSKNSALAGWRWTCTMERLVFRLIGGSYTYVYETVMDSYLFYNDGTFLYLPYDDRLVYYDGTYSTSNGKIVFKDVNRRALEDDAITTVYGSKQNLEMQYEITKDAQGEYLRTGNLQHFKTENISRTDVYRKGDSIKK